MKLKIVTYLQKIFFVFGWALLITTALKVGSNIYFLEISEAYKNFPPLVLSNLIGEIFGAIGHSFLMFLLSAIFGTVFHNEKVDYSRNHKFLHLSCFGFVGVGVVEVWHLLDAFINYLPYTPMTLLQTWYLVFSFPLTLYPAAVAFMSAVAIYILYTHYADLKKFESEVI